MNNTDNVMKQREEEQNKMKLQLKDVYGEGYPSKDHGMCIAVAYQKCPIFHDELDTKMHTIVCSLEEEKEVNYWIGHIGGIVVKRKQLDNGKVAIREKYNPILY